jgi:uncharacterized protein YdiU (UPF0061 family)
VSEYRMVTPEYDAAIDRAMHYQKQAFCKGYIEKMQEKLGVAKVEEQKEELWKHAAKCFDLAQEGKRHFYELQERSEREFMDWKKLEKPLRQWLENEAVGSDWGQDAVERTIPSYRRNFERNQRRIKASQNRIRDTDADFRKRVLNPETREAAITKYVRNHVHYRHYIAEALNILFEQLEQRR